MIRKTIAVVSALLITASLAAASIVSQPAATVNLIRNTVITTDQLNAQVERLRASGMTGMTNSDVLQIMINDELFLQGAERAGITVSDRQADNLYRQVYGNAVQQAAQSGVTITEADFQAEVLRQFSSLDEYKESLKRQAIMQQYLAEEKGEELSDIPRPADAEINAFYRQNQQGFFQPEYVRIAHIFKEKTGDAAKDQAKREELQKASDDIKAGRITFEAAVPIYSEDQTSINNAGDIGMLAYNNTQARQGWGDAFCDTLLAMNAGEISDVLESNTGYHIVKVSVHSPAKLLALTDPVSPDNPSMTVRDYISQILMMQTSQTMMAEAYQEIVSGLREEARINILYRGE